jgi:hypothetical protein
MDGPEHDGGGPDGQHPHHLLHLLHVRPRAQRPLARRRRRLAVDDGSMVKKPACVRLYMSELFFKVIIVQKLIISDTTRWTGRPGRKKFQAMHLGVAREPCARMHVIGQCLDPWAACREGRQAGNFHFHRHRPATTAKFQKRAGRWPATTW